MCIRDRPCTFIDEYHTQIGYNVFHICQFAEIMERNGASYMPAVSYTHLHAANLNPEQLSELLRMFAADMAPKPDTINTMNEEETQNEI